MYAKHSKVNISVCCLFQHIITTNSFMCSTIRLIQKSKDVFFLLCAIFLCSLLLAKLQYGSIWCLIHHLVHHSINQSTEFIDQEIVWLWIYMCLFRMNRRQILFYSSYCALCCLTGWSEKWKVLSFELAAHLFPLWWIIFSFVHIRTERSSQHLYWP